MFNKEKERKIISFLCELYQSSDIWKNTFKSLPHLFRTSILWGDYNYPHCMHGKKCGLKRLRGRISIQT